MSEQMSDRSKESKYWKNMYILSEATDPESNFIISKEPPVKFEDTKNVILSHQIKESEYEEVATFYEKYNQMSTGNTTLLPVQDLKRYLEIENAVVLMRSTKGVLIGTIISLLLPIKNKNNEGTDGTEPEEVIIHGCTTFLAVHPALRKMGLCMALIRELINYCYEKGLYCDYHMVSFKIGDNSVPINSWYRPINLKRSKQLGFLYNGHQDSLKSTKVRLKYRTKLPNNHHYLQVSSDNQNIISSLHYYKHLAENKKFSFWPDESFWEKWVKSFPTYIIYKNNEKIGIVSLNTIYCVIERTKERGKLVFPIICEGEMRSVMQVLCTISYELGYDVIYFHQHGGVTEESLEAINSIKTITELWFSLYNNQIQIIPEDIHVPLL